MGGEMRMQFVAAAAVPSAVASAVKAKIAPNGPMIMEIG